MDLFNGSKVQWFTKPDMIDASKNIVTRAQNPVKLTFKNINQTVEVVSEGNDGYEKGKVYQKKIIKDCNGYAMPG